MGRLALRLKEAELGRRLTDQERARVLERGAELAGPLIGSGGDFNIGEGVKGTDLAAAAMDAGAMLVPRARRS